MQYEYNLKYNKYICLNCTKRSKLNPSNKFIKVNIENENIITDKFKNFLNNFKKNHHFVKVFTEFFQF